ncbi:MAG TPA: aminotransferase class V-fold PLP-dependent enzyme [Gemmatimonadaceae bacterium]
MTHASSRRAFIGAATKLAIAAPAALAIPDHVLDAASLDSWLVDQGIGSLADSRPHDVVARDESYWARVRRLYNLQPDVLNFDNGWTNPAPATSIDELARHSRRLEGLPAEHLPGMWEKISNTTLRSALAKAMNVSGDEIALLRNATEALDNVLLGYKLNAGDEIVCSKHDYYAMLDALEQRKARDGVVLKIIEPTIPFSTIDEIVSLYRKHIGSRTRIVLLTHPSNLTGQAIPVRQIADIAHAAGADVVVDGAQSLGLLEDPIKSLNCDFYGASTHKWLGTPVGLGILWMRPDKMNKVWPLIPSPSTEKGMSRFEWIGTAPEYINVASLPALALHQQLGAARKAARLLYLASVLRKTVTAAHPNARFYTNGTPGMTFGLTTFEIPGVDSAKVQKELREKHGILIQAMTGIRSDSRIKGIRISPNVYHSAAEVQRFAAALKQAARTV